MKPSALGKYRPRLKSHEIADIRARFKACDTKHGAKTMLVRELAHKYGKSFAAILHYSYDFDAPFKRPQRELKDVPTGPQAPKRAVLRELVPVEPPPAAWVPAFTRIHKERPAVEQSLGITIL